MKHKKHKKIQGSGGGKGGRGTPNVARITGTSTSVAYILGAISEGPIQGFGTNPLTRVYLDETPVKNEDNSDNFKNVQFDYRAGTQIQSPIELFGFGDTISNEISVNSAVEWNGEGNNLGVTQQIQGGIPDEVKVKLSFQMQRQNPDNGNIETTNIEFQIIIQREVNNAYETLFTYYNVVSGRYSSPTEFDYRFRFPPVTGLGNLSIKVIKLTLDNAETEKAGYQRNMSFVSYAKITNKKLNYPNTALAAFSFDTSGFSSVPNVLFEVFGRLVQVPSNAIIDGLNRRIVYDGVWNGVFQTPNVAVSDPAWILYDLITNTRYGLGKYIDTKQIDKWGLYEISKYCNELVPSGYSTNGSPIYEPRFQCNIVLQAKTEAYQVLESLITIFRGFAYWQAGTITFIADKPDAIKYQFTQADVEDGVFIYSRVGLKSKKTVALVSWLNPADFYRKTVEMVEDPIAIQKWGIKELELEAIACTSRGQARRAGVAALISDRLEQETVTFKARAYAAFIKPGDIITISDSERLEMRAGGLIVSATTTTINLDSPVTLVAGQTYQISVTLSDGTWQQETIENTANTTSVVTVTSAFSAAPPPESNWILSGNSVVPKQYRVINRVPVSETIEGMHEITASEYDSTKYSFIDSMSTI
jgi:predicted phage tail protein